MANGNSEVAANLLKMYGMDTNAAGSYGTIANRQLATQLAKRAATGSGGSGRSSDGGWSNSEIRNLKKDRDAVAAKGGDTSWYDNILAANGYPVSERSSQSGGSIGLAALKELNQSSKWSLPGGTTGGSTGKSTGMPYSNALSYAKGWKEQGMDADTIASRLMNLGASDDVIDRAMQNAGF